MGFEFHRRRRDSACAGALSGAGDGTAEGALRRQGLPHGAEAVNPLRAFALPTILAAAAACGGCAHTIRIAPDTDRWPTAAGERRADVNVAYYVDPADRARTVTTPGGGGDKVAYAPYKDLEAPLYRVLSNVFGRVYPLSDPNDATFIAEKSIRFVFRPHFETNSSSDSLLTWPPTEFTLTIEVDAVDAASRPVWKTRATGVGRASYSEFKHDPGLAAKRAAEQVFGQLNGELLKFPQ
ncbi:hypothetical protein [Dokdonella ginsengisoli]|uniref:DUF4136 domain-containing protein n=1 Tax=Dokdonella ginsengisoli TaxID=363846 RepID=A0ABV9QQN8_9GAMM